MPRENKQRGRRGDEKKRKLENGDGDGADHDGQKRQRVAAPEDADFVPVAADDGQQPQHHVDGIPENGDGSWQADKPFFGMLDEEEQEYFKRADEMLELNSFADPDERNLFLANVYREADGKELKIANSQSCSRLMERLIQLSTPAQLKTLFQKFSGNFMHLIQHRFASHCCEKLFTQAAPVVTQELLEPPKASTSDNVYVSMESLFLYTIGELEGNIGFLMTDRFATHALRVLLLVLAGEPLESTSTKSLLRSKKKENVAVNGIEAVDGEAESKRTVPGSFTDALQKFITDSIAGLDTNSLRALATHPLGNPTLQLLLRLELTHFGKQRAKDEKSIIRTLLPDDPLTAESESASFINNLMYDPIGSHLMETIVEYAPGKMFKVLYKELLKERLASLARNEIAGYVACKVLERLSKEDLLQAHELIVPQLPNLLERNRFTIVKTLIQRCVVREVDTQAIAAQIDIAYKGSEDGFDLTKLLRLGEDTVVNGMNGDGPSNTDGVMPPPTSDRSPQSAKIHGAILAQAMILVPGPLSGLVFDSLVQVPLETLLKIARDPVASRTLQAALTSTNASIISRRKLVQQFYGQIGEMALDRSASHVVDSIWEGTHGLAFIRERIAEELAENEASLRNSPCGRGVWKNWKMDIYKRKRGEWIRQSKIKASNDGFQSFSELDKNKEEKAPGQEGKSALQLAREKHAANKARKEQRMAQRGRGGGGGGNSTATVSAATSSA